jgi:hypothetical protein
MGKIGENMKWLHILIFFLTLSSCDKKPLKIPFSVAEGVQVKHFLSIGPNCVRIVQDPVTKQIVYTTFNGSVYEIDKNRFGKPFSKLRFTLDDHGVSELQGIAFLGDTMFLVGNIKVNKGKGTRGIGMRAIRSGKNKYEWTPFFITEEMGGNKTIFNHGFNATEISPDGKYVYVNSGARTDHGELQDNDGLYPYQRDVPLTSCILRFPSDAFALTLRNDRDWLLAQGFLFTEGLRNAYDMAFTKDNRLFAVVNSSDYDHPEDMFEIKMGQHYGFPWVMGQLDNPQQFLNWIPDATVDPFIPETSHAYQQKYFSVDSSFPKKPMFLHISKPVLNEGPRLNHYRDIKTGKVMDADTTGHLVGTFTPHSCPLGLLFDTKGNLGGKYKYSGFTLSWTDGENFELMSRISQEGEELVHLEMVYDPMLENYKMKTTSLVDNFLSPTDAVLIDNNIFVIEYGHRANIWQVTLPSAAN